MGSTEAAAVDVNDPLVVLRVAAVSVLEYTEISNVFVMYENGDKRNAPVGSGSGGDRAFASTVASRSRTRGQLGRVIGYIILENWEEPGLGVDLVYVACVDECCAGSINYQFGRWEHEAN